MKRSSCTRTDSSRSSSCPPILISVWTPCKRWWAVYLPAYQEVCVLPPEWREVVADLLCLCNVLMLGVLAEAWGIGTLHEQLEQPGDWGIFERYAQRVCRGEPTYTIHWARL